MAYDTGILNKRVTILRRSEGTDGVFGREGGGYTPLRTVWAAVDFSRGLKAMREGALDAYDSIMVRLRFAADITRECRLEYDGRTWNIDSFHADEHRNQIQITATELRLG